MVSEDDENKILGYLKKEGQTNTFRLARELGINRHRILDAIKKLEEKKAVEVKSGIVNFLRFPAKEKKEVKKVIKKAPSKKIKRVKAKRKPNVLEATQAENKRLREKLSELEKAPPKIIRRIKVKKIIQKVPVKSKKLKEQAEHIEELKETIKELKKKVSKPKIIRRTIIKKIIKRVPVKPKKEVKPRKFKLPKFNIAWVKKIRQLNKPKFIKQKINIKTRKINFSVLNKNIQQLRVPEIFRNH